MSNKRQHDRVPFNEHVVLLLPDGSEIAGYARDAGFGGYLLEPDHPIGERVQVGMACRIAVDLFGQNTLLECRVMRITAAGVGLQLQRVNPAPEVNEGTNTP
ncbi:MAG: PilZ domain-containing protein [Magnetococcales bacterium]|nr:PilZ domain-containing protein [Magnetococcales bacterium]